MILCFTGTGNSLTVAELLAAKLNDEVVMMDTDQYTSPRRLSDGERLVWVMPVHSWGIPKAVDKYMRKIAIGGAENARHYLVVTCGDDCGLTADIWRKNLCRRGWDGRAAHSVFMPNTYVLLPGFNVDSQKDAEAKMDAMKARVEEIGHAIKCSSPIDNIFRGKFAWLKSRIIYPLFMKFMTSPKPFKTTNDCIACGKCENICPMANIKIDNAERRPVWGRNCTICLGCYHVCPRHAVAYGSKTANKGQWQESIRANRLGQ